MQRFAKRPCPADPVSMSLVEHSSAEILLKPIILRDYRCSGYLKNTAAGSSHSRPRSARFPIRRYQMRASTVSSLPCQPPAKAVEEILLEIGANRTSKLCLEWLLSLHTHFFRPFPLHQQCAPVTIFASSAACAMWWRWT